MTFFMEDIDSNGNKDDRWAMKVNVMACSQASDYHVDAAYSGIKKAHDEIHSSTNVPGTRVTRYDTDFAATSCDEDNEQDDANQWLDDNGFGGNELYLFVSECGVAKTFGNAWRSRSVGFVGSGSGYYNDYHEMYVMAIHESLHAFLEKACRKVQDEAGTWNSWSQVDHKLGHIIKTGSGDKSSPIIATYASKSNHKDWVTSGECSNYSNIGWGEWTSQLSACTLDSIDYTLNHIKY